MVGSDFSSVRETEAYLLALTHKTLYVICKNREELFFCDFFLCSRHTDFPEIRDFSHTVVKCYKASSEVCSASVHDNYTFTIRNVIPRLCICSDHRQRALFSL